MKRTRKRRGGGWAEIKEKAEEARIRSMAKMKGMSVEVYMEADAAAKKLKAKATQNAKWSAGDRSGGGRKHTLRKKRTLHRKRKTKKRKTKKRRKRR
jgi:hypothetical protein